MFETQAQCGNVFTGKAGLNDFSGVDDRLPITIIVPEKPLF
jgi:hypothetical protein